MRCAESVKLAKEFVNRVCQVAATCFGYLSIFWMGHIGTNGIRFPRADAFGICTVLVHPYPFNKRGGFYKPIGGFKWDIPSWR